jgi:lipid II:glycine glycyltransferase (peptidoglycan interpeptide bridge formation enzyme)
LNVDVYVPPSSYPALDASEVAPDAGYHVRLIDTSFDPAWDAFLAAAPGGHYAQASLWAQAKMPLGWQVMRVVVTHSGQIRAGAQVLIRRLPLIGAIGYVPRGPLVAGDDHQLAALVTAWLLKVTQVYRLRYLLVLPPHSNEAIIQELLRSGCRPRARAETHTATALIDLTHDTDSILQAMRKSTRHNIRAALRHGMTIREGTADDIDIFHSLMLATGGRRRFPAFPKSYYRGLWNILHPAGWLHLHIAEYAGEPVAASLTISLGDTVTDWAGAWSGQHGKAHPNELLLWSTVNWAKARGHRYFDLDGINPTVAGGAVAPDPHTDGGTFFKLGFGADPVLYPGPYEYIPNPALRWLYTAIAHSIAAEPLRRRLEHIARGVE